MNYILNRLSEASTWKGIISLIALAGVKLEPAQADTIITAAVSIVAAISIFTKHPASADASNEKVQ